MSDVRELMRREKARRKQQETSATRVSVCGSLPQTPGCSAQRDRVETGCCERRVAGDPPGDDCAPATKRSRLISGSHSHGEHSTAQETGVAVLSCAVPSDFFDQCDAAQYESREMSGPRLPSDPTWVSRAWGDEHVTIEEEYCIIGDDSADIKKNALDNRNDERTDGNVDPRPSVGIQEFTECAKDATRSHHSSNAFLHSDLDFSASHRPAASAEEKKLDGVQSVLPDDFFDDSSLEPAEASRAKAARKEHELQNALAAFHQEVDLIEQIEAVKQHDTELEKQAVVTEELEDDSERLKLVVKEIKQKKEQVAYGCGSVVVSSKNALRWDPQGYSNIVEEENESMSDTTEEDEGVAGDHWNADLLRLQDSAWRQKTFKKS